MKLTTYRQAGEERLGAIIDGTIIDLNRAYAALMRDRGSVGARHLADALVPTDAVAFLSGGEEAFEAASMAIDFVKSRGHNGNWARRELLSVPMAEVELLPPVPRPGKIVCIARNYLAHAEEAGRPAPEMPILFARFPSTLIGPGKAIVRPRVSKQLDWEGELAVVIGKRCRAVRRDEAMSVVAAYALFNDVTIRDYQFRVSQYTAGKNFETSGPFGPYLVTRDEVPDPHALELITTLNDEVVQRANTRDMFFDIPTLVEHISEFISLEPGDVIATGTPSGVGFVRKPPRFMVPGDVVRVSATGLGTLENPVVDEE